MPVVCPACERRLPESAFYVTRWRSSGLSYRCRACTIEDARARYLANRAGGRCGCGGPLVPDYTHCDRCLRRARAYMGARRWQPGRAGRPPGERPRRIVAPEAGARIVENGPTPSETGRPPPEGWYADAHHPHTSKEEPPRDPTSA